MIKQLAKVNLFHLGWDTLIIIAASYLSLYLRVGLEGMDQFLGVLHRHLPLFLAIRLTTFVCMGAYNIIWRYVSLRDAVTIARAVIISTVLIIAASYVIDIGRLPRATFFIEAFLLTVFLLGIRLLRRLRYEYSFEKEVERHGKATLIFGAGTNGRLLAQRLAVDSHSGFRLIGFVDDNPQKIGRLVAGTKVLSGRADLASLIQNYEVTELIITPARLEASIMREIVQIAHANGIQPRVLTAFAQKSAHGQPLRNIELGDLLNRPRRVLDLEAVRELVRGKRILITGAGGSIGSELARQILSHSPGKLILCDHSEYNLYQIDRELRPPEAGNELVVPVLSDIKLKEPLEAVFKEHQPEIVVHAAAYKHVHLVEANPYPAILNNILGTRNLLELAQAFGVETFILISTDKAVNPAGVMGATKRVCELMVAATGLATHRRYCAVRFGNVLGSSGSLIPLLSSQIQAGGPMTITHANASRYFMLISEAVSLVLKAGAIAQPGDISLLDMGEPVRIVDIAKALVVLMGKKEGDIPIVYTGLRPGEKLFEELYIQGNELVTSDPNILVLPRGEQAKQGLTGIEQLNTAIDRIIELAFVGHRDALHLIAALIQQRQSVASAEWTGFGSLLPPGRQEPLPRSQPLPYNA